MVASEELCQNFSVLTMLAKGSTYNYIVPSFPVFNADIVEVQFQWEEVHKDESTKVHVFDGFARRCQDLDHPLPGIVRVEFSYDCAFMFSHNQVPPFTFTHVTL